MCVHINTFPDDCLLPIFDRVPLSDLLRLDKVCPRWKFLLPSACARRRTLVLILGGWQLDTVAFHIPFSDTFEIEGYNEPVYDLPMPEREASFTLSSLLPRNDNLPNTSFDQFLQGRDDSKGFFDILYRTSLDRKAIFTEMARFVYAQLSGQLVTYFTELFPNVVNLVVIHPDCYDDELHSLIDLIEFWPLVTLKLWLRIRDKDDAVYRARFYSSLNGTQLDPPDQHPAPTLLRNINQQSSLQHLTLDISGYELEDDYTIPMEFYSFIEQLKVVKLFLGFYDQENAIWDIMHRFNSTKLRNIGLGNYEYPQAEAALNPKFDFTTKVSQLYFFNTTCFETAEQFDEFCWRFSSLTMLEMFWTRDCTFTRLVSNLALLSQLTHLTLNIDFAEHPTNAFALLDGDDGADDEPRRISLPQVKILQMYISKRSHNQFELLCPRVFPSVEVIILEDYDYLNENACTICAPNQNGEYARDEASEEQCHRLLILSLKNKFSGSLLRLYAECGDTLAFGDCIDYEQTKDDDLPEIGGDDGGQPEELDGEKEA